MVNKIYTFSKVAQVLADIAIEEWPFGTDEFIGSDPASKRICDRVGITDPTIIAFVQTLLYHSYDEDSKALFRENEKRACPHAY